MKLDFLITPNGLGHSRRNCNEIVLLAKNKPKIKVSVSSDFCRAPWLLKFWKGFSRHIELRNLDILNKSGMKLDSFPVKYVFDCDILISDNLRNIDVVKNSLNKKILSTNFFWEEKFQGKGFNIERSDIDWDLVITNYYFGTKLTQKVSDFKRKFYNPTIVGSVGRLQNSKAGLINFGNSANPILDNRVMVEYLSDIYLKKLASIGIKAVLADEKYIPMIEKHGLTRVGFAEKDSFRITTALIRPGLGSICDLLSTGAYIFCVFESSDREMSTNCCALAGFGGVSAHVVAAGHEDNSFASIDAFVEAVELNIDLDRLDWETLKDRRSQCFSLNPVFERFI